MDYTDENRGHFQNIRRAKQVIEFADIKYGNITPTDIDGFFERHNEAFVFFELKKRGAELPSGQKLALTRLVDNLRGAGKKSVLFVAAHDVGDCDKSVVAAEAEVTDIYFNGAWYREHGKTLKEMSDRFIKWSETGERQERG